MNLLFQEFDIVYSVNAIICGYSIITTVLDEIWLEISNEGIQRGRERMSLSMGI